jgi:hypothetical protein
MMEMNDLGKMFSFGLYRNTTAVGNLTAWQDHSLT